MGDRTRKSLESVKFAHELRNIFKSKFEDGTIWSKKEREAAVELLDINIAATMELGACNILGGKHVLKQAVSGSKREEKRKRSSIEGGRPPLQTMLQSSKKARLSVPYVLAGKENKIPTQRNGCSSGQTKNLRRKGFQTKNDDFLVNVKMNWSAADLIPKLAAADPKRRRSATIQALIKGRKIPVGKSVLYARIKYFNAGRLDLALKPWWDLGGPETVTDDEIKDFLAGQYDACIGQTVHPEEFKKFLDDMRRKKRLQRGLADDGQRCSRHTFELAWVRATNLDGTKVVKPAAKSEARFTSETSLRTALAFATTVLTAHHLPAAEYPEGYVEDEVDKLVSRSHDGSDELCGSWVDPGLVLSSDDVTMVLGIGANGETEYCLANANYKGDKTRANFSTNPNARTFNPVMRVVLTMTFTGRGECAAPYITVKGLSEAELPKANCPSGFLSVEIPQLHPDVDSGVGYINFVRSATDHAGSYAEGLPPRDDEEGSATAEVDRTRHYREKVLKPLIKRCRTDLRLLHGEAFEGIAATCVAWLDGARAQIKSIVEDLEHHLTNIDNLIHCKHSAGATGVQQPCDLSPIFRILKALERNMVSLCFNVVKPMRYVNIEKCFEEVERTHGLKLKRSKRKLLLDFMCKLPTMLGKACTVENIVSGFRESGMIDYETGKPNFERMLRTCRNIQTHELVPIEENLAHLLHEQRTKGYIDDDTLDHYGIREDVDTYGDVIRRDATITNESCQRAKNLSAPYQCGLREEVKVRALEKKKEEAEKSNRFILDHLERSKKAVKKMTGSENADSATLAQLSLAEFAKPLGPELKSFHFVRKFASKAESKAFKYPNKGKLSEAKKAAKQPPEAEENLINYAFQMRAKSIKLRQPEVLLPVSTAVLPRPIPNVVAAFPRTTSVISRAPGDPPSTLLQNSAWLSRFNAVFRGFKTPTDLDDSQRENADKLSTKLLQRLDTHLKRKVSTPKARFHKVWNFFRDNVSNLAAMIQCADHVRRKIELAKHDDALWNHNANVFTPIPLQGDDGNPSRSWVGGYYFKNEVTGLMVRSGKASRPMHERMAEHVKNASDFSKCNASTFYSHFPHEDIKDKFTETMSGTFADLGAYVCIGFSADPADFPEVCSHFTWRNDLKSLWTHESKFHENKLRMDLITYSIELAYELMLAPRADLSECPGFERFIYPLLGK